ncbi:MAG: hypothetical protein NUV68_05970 [Caldiserica bacterium]|jgi:hypothetical protein|nr:hypothetical protein [Caldisericota bacterium]MDH7562872.1 hypothetical protein [Caldisericota bacterium]
MTKKGIALLIIAVFSIGILVFFGQATAQSDTPGSREDPLITKSYIDQFLIPTVLELKAGQSIIGEAGTEFVVRVGSTYCLADPATTKGGIADLTGGVDIKHMEPVPLNHHLVIPRSDGRGLFAQTDVVLMVWGKYQLLGE